MRGGMLSGWAASRTGQPLGTESQLTFGGWQGGHRPRWPVPPSTTTFHKSCHWGWSPHISRERYRLAQPNRTPDRILRNIRRPRHARDASTERAVTRFLRDSHHHKIQLSRFPVRADTAVRPYAEDLFQEQAIPQSNNIKNRFFVTSGDLGTHGMHPPRERTPVSCETVIITTSNRYVFLCRRTRRSAPTQRICFRKRLFHSQTTSKTEFS